ncbi:MAG: helix-turn-helix transcriptional regulator, partial [Bacteroidetes bacterium]|nr:helix-turn-helix transcriptional regulator [Bacteroidota bacterium]
YFKKNTAKTFSQFLNEIRIGHACKLLTEENYPVAEVAYLCGFKNISNFNRRFKDIMGYTPTEYQFRQAHELDIKREGALDALARLR